MDLEMIGDTGLFLVVRGPAGRIRIARADPVVRVAKEIMDEMETRWIDAWVPVEFFTDDRGRRGFKIVADNQTAVYLIGEWDELSMTYLCHWPD